MQRLEKWSSVCEKCQTDGSASLASYFKIQFTPNKNFKENVFPPLNKYNFRIGEYCTGCDRWKKWAKQAPELMDYFKDAILSF